MTTAGTIARLPFEASEDVDYVLDTNVLRALPTTIIRSATERGHALLVSPISVWELLAHFEECPEEFQRVKGWLRKAALCEIMNHPDAESREAIGVANYIPEHARIAWREREGALAVLAIFAAANTAEDVHRGRFVDSRGNLHTTEGCGRRARTALGELRTGHRDFVEPLVAAFRDEFIRLERDPRRDDALTDKEFFEHLVREVRRIAATADTPTIGHVEERLFEFAFARIGHAVESALFCVRNSSSTDPNDYGDALLCQHIDLATERVLVTDDRGIRDALARAEARLRRLGSAQALELRSTPLVIDSATFKRMAEQMPPRTRTKEG